MGEDRGGGESVCVHVADVRTPILTPQPPSLTLPPQAGEENVERTAYAVRMLKLEGEGILMFTAFTFRRNLLRLKARVSTIPDGDTKTIYYHMQISVRIYTYMPLYIDRSASTGISGCCSSERKPIARP